MKKLLFMIIVSINIFAADYAQYKSNFGLGLGMGFPTGYEAKVIYRQSDWLSLSLNYNILQIRNLGYEVSDGLKASGNIVFSTPGIMAHFHPLGGNLRISTGYLYDYSDISISADGDIEIEGETIPVTGNASIEFGTTYPYIGVGYGYDYNSTIHLDFSLGVYLVKAPKVDIYLTTSDLEGVITNVLGGTLSAAQIDEMVEIIEGLGGNILDAPYALDQVYTGGSIDMPTASELEDILASAVQEGYDYLPKVGDYNILPVMSFGFTVFLF